MFESDGESEAPAPGEREFSWLDAGLVAGAVLSLLLACWMESRKKYFWADELFTWTLVTDRSFLHMLRALAGGADGAPPLFYSLGWLWARSFGAGELSLRLFSSIAFGSALAIIWRSLAKEYGTRAALLGTLTVFCASWELLRQNAEARFYGLLTLLVAGAIAMFRVFARHHNASHGAYVGTAVVHAGLVLCHVYGGLYSAGILAAMILWDRRLRQWRPMWYGSVLIGWMAFLPWLLPFLGQMQLFKPHSWIPVPTAGSLLRVYAFKNPTLMLVSVVLAGVVLIRARSAQRSERRKDSRLLDFPLPYVAVMLLTIPVAAYGISHVSSSIFLDRYFIPASLGAAILVAHAASRVVGPKISGLVPRVSWALVYVTYVSGPLSSAALVRTPSIPSATLPLFADSDQPIVDESSHSYLALAHYAAPGHRESAARVARARGESPDRMRNLPTSTFVVDLEVALDSLSARGALNEARLLERRLASFRDPGVTTTAQLLCAHDAFLVIDDPDHVWYERRVAADPSFQSRQIASDGWRRLVAVRRLPSRASTSAKSDACPPSAASVDASRR